MSRLPLVSTEWLADQLQDPALRVFDTTLHLEPTPSGLVPRSARRDYAARHIPGAGFLDIVSDLSDPGSELAFTRPRIEALVHALSRSGVSPESRVVLYSAGEIMWATRAWWLLRWAGARAFVLDGGLAKWASEGRELSQTPCGYPSAEFAGQPTEDCWATKAEVVEAIRDGGACTINALPRPLHLGTANLGYRRPGRIAGSENVPYPALMDRSTGCFAEPQVLREHFEAIGALERERVICYCGGGIAATQNALALVLLGHAGVSVYDGGLDEWSRDLDLPMESS